MFAWRICPTFRPALTVLWCVRVRVCSWACVRDCVHCTCRRSLRPALTALLCVSDLIHLHPDHWRWFLAVWEEKCVFNQLTLSLMHTPNLSLLLPQSSGCRVFITFGLKGVSDSITQPACDATQWGVPLLFIIIDTEHTHVCHQQNANICYTHAYNRTHIKTGQM